MASKKELTEREFDLELAKLGVEAEAFERSALGRYIYDRVEAEVEDLTMQLVAADPFDKDLNLQLRSEIKSRAMVPAWIKEAINSGNMAARRIEDEETAEF